MSSSSAAVDPPDPPPHAALPITDLRHLSKSDLYKLSVSSYSPSTVTPSVPIINKAIFNESAGSKKQTYSRLRLAPRNTLASLSVNKSAIPDDEAAENSRIISILKGLVYGDSHDVEMEVTEIRDVVVGEKRKRGRPRRDSNPNLQSVSASKVFVSGSGNGKARAKGNSDYVEKGENGGNMGDVERDKERRNGKGVEVDLGVLVRVEDPYREELEKRSEGLSTEDEFLGFLGGLSGQWGSRRRKRRVVDAGEFGDVLPKGWKLILSLKKKEKRIWVHVRRYISPSGRHFVTCKEVASYLRSVFGLEGENQSSFQDTNNNDHSTPSAANIQTVDPAVNVQTQEAANIHPAYPAVNVQSTQEVVDVPMSGYVTDPAVNVQSEKGVTDVQAADPAVKDINVSQDIEHCPPSVVNHVPDPKQNIQAEDILRCQKCDLSFNGQDDLMQHKLSSHRRKRSKFGSSITDGVIIKDGLYECQFCHKTFVERHRYNGHVGAHKRHHKMNDEGSSQVAVSLPSSVDLGSPIQIDPKESTVQASAGDDSDSNTANYGTDSQSKVNLPGSTLILGSDKEVPSDQPYIGDDNMSHDEKEARSVMHAQFFVKSDMDHKVDSSLGGVSQANQLAAALFCTSSESEDPMPIDETNPISNLTANNIDGSIPSFSGQDHTAEIDIIGEEVPVTNVDPSLQADSVIISFAVEENENACDVDNDFPINLPLVGPAFDSMKSGTSVTHRSSSSSVSASGDQDQVRSHDMDMVSSSVLTEPKHKSFPESTNEVLFGFKDIHEGCIPLLNLETDTAQNCDNNIKTGHEKSISCLNIPPQPDELSNRMDHGSRDFCMRGAFGHEKSSEIRTASIDLRNIAHAEPERPKIDKITTYRSNENAFGVSHQILRPEVRRPEFGLPFLSGNQQFFGGENASGFSSLQPQQKNNVDSCFRTDNYLGNSFSDVYSMNRVANSSMGPKPDTALNSGNSELMIDFGNNSSGIVTNPMDNVPMEQIFFEIDRSRESRQTGEESKQESNLLGPSYYSKPGSSENYLDRIDAGSVWDGPILDGVAGFGHDKLMIGFSNSGAQSHSDPMGANFWRTDERNTLSNLAGPATQHDGSSSFLNANIIPDKDDMFLGFNGVQSAPTEHVEFSFMTPHSLNSYPRDTKAMYNPGMAQGFDSSFWFGKDDDLSLNLAARNLVTSICVWCRNEFRHEPENAATQHGAIGSICPTCSARVSQQFNVF